MEKIIYGIPVSLFGIAVILTSSGGATAVGLIISFVGLAISSYGFFNSNKK